MNSKLTSRPFDQRLAGWLVRPLARAEVHPHVVTASCVGLSVLSCIGFASGSAGIANWAAGAFVLGRFLDHVDGELARHSARSSLLGYWLDYLAGGTSYALLFVGIALGQARGELAEHALWLGGVAAVCAVIAVFVNVTIDRASGSEQGHGYPSFSGVELEDGIYLLAPVTWLGYLSEFFVLACIGASVYLLYCVVHLLWLTRDRDG